MLIDWFTVGAQVLNFVFLVWLMKRFLYQPVLDAIAAREKRIADQIAAAAAKEAHATTERKTFEDKNKAFDQQRADLLSEATVKAEAEGQRLAEEARKAAAALAAQRQQSLATQAAQLQQLVAERAAHEVFAILHSPPISKPQSAMRSTLPSPPTLRCASRLRPMLSVALS